MSSRSVTPWILPGSVLPVMFLLKGAKSVELTVLLDRVADDCRHLDAVALQADVQDFIWVEFLVGPIT